MPNTQRNQTFEYIDSIRRKVYAVRKEPEFSEKLSERLQRMPDLLQSDHDILETFAKLIAYSQHAQAKLVANLLSTGNFQKAFHNFDVEEVRVLRPTIVEATYWNDISAIRFKKKIAAIINCAKSLHSVEAKYRSFTELLGRTGIPPVLQSPADVEKFWQGFDDLLRIMKEVEMPFFRSMTSLLHFLLTVGYDCVKPDMVVMKVAKKGNMVPSETGDKNLKKVVKDIQLYSVDRGIKPSVVDLYFLIYGGQTGVKGLTVVAPDP